MRDLEKPLQQETIRHFRAHITVLPRTVALQKILALPSIVLNLDRRHSIEPLFNLAFLPNRQKRLVTLRETQK